MSADLDEMRTMTSAISALDEELGELEHRSFETSELDLQGLRLEAEAAAIRLRVAERRHAEDVARRAIVDRREDAVNALEATKLKLLNRVAP